MTGSDPGLFQTIYTTRALRRFRPDPVPDDLLYQVIDAGLRGATGGARQIARFVIVRDEAKKRQIGEWYWNVWREYGKQYVDDPASIDRLPRQMRLVVRSTDHLARHLAETPVLLFVVAPKSEQPGGAAGSIFPAIQNMLLSIRALGLGSVVTTFHRRHEAAVCALLGIPDTYETHAMLPVGFPTDKQGPVRRPLSVRRVAFLDGWEQPWPYAQEQPENGLLDRWAATPDGGSPA
jgi:nitroreductase